LVEGESDCQTLWFHNVPAVGVPGAGTWRQEWAEYLTGIDRVYLVIEPDKGGDILLRKVMASGLENRLHIVRLEDFKDVSDLHVDDPDRFLERWKQAVAAATVAAETAPAPGSPDLSLTELMEELGGLSREPSADELESFITRAGETWRVLVPEQMRETFRSQVVKKLTKAGVSSPSKVAKEILSDPQAPEPSEPEPVHEPGGLQAFPEKVQRQGRGLLRCSNLLDLASQIMNWLGLRGEESNRKVVFLAGVSGHLLDPIHLVVHGASAGGKNMLVRSALALLPPDRVLSITGLSAHALEYMGGTVEGVLAINEASGQRDADYTLRVGMSEGTVSRLTVNRSEAGSLVPEERTVEIRASVITTTTELALHAENQTRVFDLWIDESPGLTAEVIEVRAREAAGESPTDRSGPLSIWHAAMWMLEPVPVVIPFAPLLAADFPKSEVRARRDFPRVLTLLGANARLYQLQREKDEQGRVIATIEDYRVVYPLIQAIIGPTLTGLTDKAKQLCLLYRELSGEPYGFVSRIDLQKEADRRRIASQGTIEKWFKRFRDLGIWHAEMERGCWTIMEIRDPFTELIPLPSPDELAEMIS